MNRTAAGTRRSGGELIGGGFLGYELTAEGRAELQRRVVARSRHAA